jgi:hypothetical protein
VLQKITKEYKERDAPFLLSLGSYSKQTADKRLYWLRAIPVRKMSEALDIRKERIDPGQPWQNYIEAKSDPTADEITSRALSTL